MNSVLKEDFEKKMTVVGLLKQYAEQRDVETFARGLSVVLSAANHQPLLQHIRLSFDLLFYQLSGTSRLVARHIFAEQNQFCGELGESITTHIVPYM